MCASSLLLGGLGQQDRRYRHRGAQGSRGHMWGWQAPILLWLIFSVTLGETRLKLGEDLVGGLSNIRSGSMAGLLLLRMKQALTPR